MAEVMKLHRKEYRERRKKYKLYQQIGLAVLAVLLLIFSVLYFKSDKAVYVSYAEEGNAVHYAHLNEDGQKWHGVDKLNGTHAYISAQIEKMSAEFSYKLKFDTDEVKYTYSYVIDTQLEILDVQSKAPLYNPIVCTQVEATVVSGEGNAFAIAKHVEIDFAKYNGQAAAFISESNLKDTSSSLIVRMSVSVKGASESFVTDHSDEYVTELRIPLCQLAFKPVVSSSVPAGEKRILAVSGNLRTFFAVMAIVSLVAFVAGIGVYIFFLLHTRDNYTDYALKVARIRKNYKSYIQRISEEYPTDGCRVLHLGEFTELLEIRDVVQKPILMYENAARTCTKFIILSDGLIYMYEVKIELGADADPASLSPVQAESTLASDGALDTAEERSENAAINRDAENTHSEE